MLSPPPPQGPIGSDSDSEDTPMETNVDRLQFLAAAGLVQRPITKRQEQLPPLPPDAIHPSPSISFHPSTPLDSHHHPSNTHSPSHPSTPKNRHPPDHDDPLSKMEAAFSSQRDLPSPSDSPGSSSDRKATTTSRNRNGSHSVSGPRPSSEQLKLPRPISTQACLVRHNRTSSAAPSFSSSSHGFRSWLTGMSKSVSHSSSASGSSSHFDRRRSSTSAQASSVSASPDRPRLSVSSVSRPIHSLEDLPPRPSTAGNSSSLTPSPQISAHMETRTWSSLVGSATLSRYTEKEKNRQEAIYELIKTEAVFVENCQMILQVFYRELEPVIGPRASRIVFANVEDVMLFGATFLSALERRQVQSGSYHVTSVGDIVLDYMQGVHVFRPYCTNQANASRALHDLKLRPAVANLLNGLKVKGLELEHYLLQPMQRLTRYPLLIAQIIKYTDEASLDAHRLANALKKVQDVLTATNEAVRKQENDFALMSISEQLVIPGSDVKLSLATKTRFVGARRLVREGVLTKGRSRKRLRVFLFNDFVLLTREVGGQLEMYRAPMALEECQLVPGRDAQSFLLRHHHESFLLKLPDPSRASAHPWINDFDAARKDVFKALLALRARRGLAMAPF